MEPIGIIALRAFPPVASTFVAPLYVVPGAGWRPAYDTRGDVAKKEIELTYFGMVIQQTGEPWEDVELSLSTARPSLGASMPEIQPVFLSPAAFNPRPVYRRPRGRAAR